MRRSWTAAVRLAPKLVPAAEPDAGGPGAAPLLDVDVDVAALAGRWVECDVRVDASAERPRSSLHVRVADPRTSRQVHPLTPDASGRSRWRGRLPRDLVGLQLEPVDAPAPCRVLDFTLDVLPAPLVFAKAARIAPLATARALFWHVVGKKLRAQNGLRDVLTPRPIDLGSRPGRAYDAWIRENDTFSPDEIARMAAAAAEWPERPLITVLMPVYDPEPGDLRAAIESVRAQAYPHWELRIANDASTKPAIAPLLDEAAARDGRIHVVHRARNGHISAASNTALEGARGDFVALMDHDDLLPAHALLFVAREIAEHPDVDLIYTDEDKVDDRGRRHMPHFKGGWNEELLLTQNYLNHLSVFRTSLLKEIGGFREGFEGSQDHDLVLRFVERTDESRIRHIPRILYHWRNYRSSTSFSERSMEKAVEARRRALRDAVKRRGWDADVVAGALGTNRLVRRLPDPPEVAAIVPTRDAASLLRVTMRGLLRETDYPKLKVVIVDNGSVEPETFALFDELRADPRVTILPRPGPFNYSALNNDAVAGTDSPVILFLNNDVETVEPGWLREMVSGLTGDVAAVGAKLLYPDGTVQHAGVILGGGGVAGHAHPDRSRDDPGYFGRAALPQHLSAVTAACMVVRRDAFLEVGGFDAEHLTVAFNDTDLCLKLRRAGYKILFDPYATLIHHESATRGLDSAPEKRERFEREIKVMLDRWGPLLRRDPYYNPNLALDFADFRLRGVDPAGPRRERPSPPG